MRLAVPGIGEIPGAQVLGEENGGGLPVQQVLEFPAAERVKSIRSRWTSRARPPALSRPAAASCRRWTKFPPEMAVQIRGMAPDAAA